MNTSESKKTQLIPLTPFFALVKTSNSPARPTMFLIYREQESEGEPEWVATGSTFAHAKALSDRMNQSFQALVIDFLRSIKIHPDITPNPEYPAYVVREKADAPVASIPLRIVFGPQVNLHHVDVLYTIKDIAQLPQF